MEARAFLHHLEKGVRASPFPFALQSQRRKHGGFWGFPTYRIVTVCFDEEGRKVEPEGVCAEYDTGCPFPTFAIVKPAIENTRVDMSPYGQPIFADAIDAVQAVDLAFDAMVNEVDVSKMRVFLSDVPFDKERDGKKRVSIPFGKQDCTVFRKVMSTEDTIQEFAPGLPGEDDMHVLLDDAIISDTAAEKKQDMAEVGVTMAAWEYRVKRHGESGDVAHGRAAGVGVYADNIE